MSFVKVGFQFDQTVVYGECKEISRTAGVTPDTIQLRVPKSEAAKFAGNYKRTGVMLVYVKNPYNLLTPDVMLSSWSVMSIEDSVIGKAPGDSVATVQEKIITLADRRWEFIGGRGGYYTRHPCNILNQDGTASPTDNASAANLCQELVHNMQFASGETAFSTTDLAEDEPLTTAKPLNIRWDNIHIPTTLNELLNQYGYCMVLTTAGKYKTFHIGVGPDGLDAFPDTFTDSQSPRELPSDPGFHRSLSPDIVVVTSGRNRAIVQCELGLVPQGQETTTDGFQYCGFMNNGSLAEVHSLDWLGGVYSPEDIVNKKLPKGTTASQYAYDNLFTMMRLVGPHRAAYLPLLKNTTVAASDAGAGQRSVPVRVLARLPARTAATGLWSSTAAPGDVPGLEVNHYYGLITFPFPAGDVNTQNCTGRFGEFFQAFTDPGDVKVIFSHYCQDTDDYTSFYCAAFKRDPTTGVVATCDIGTAMAAGSTSDVQIIECPQLQEYRDIGWNSINGAALGVEAQKIAMGVLVATGSPKVRKFAGLYNFECNGQISSVTWDLVNCLTTVEYQMHGAVDGNLMAKDTVRGIVDNFRKRMAQADSLPSKTQMGHAQVAPQPGVLPGNPQPAVDPPLVPHWGKLKTDWDLNAGNNYVMVDECDQSGSLSPISPTVKVYIYWPDLGKVGPMHFPLKSGAIIPYIRTADSTDGSKNGAALPLWSGTVWGKVNSDWADGNNYVMVTLCDPSGSSIGYSQAVKCYLYSPETLTGVHGVKLKSGDVIRLDVPYYDPTSNTAVAHAVNAYETSAVPAPVASGDMIAANGNPLAWSVVSALTPNSLMTLNSVRFPTWIPGPSNTGNYHFTCSGGVLGWTALTAPGGLPTATPGAMLYGSNDPTPVWSVLAGPPELNCLLYSGPGDLPLWSPGRVLAGCILIQSGTPPVPTWLSGGSAGDVLTMDTNTPSMPSWKPPIGSGVMLYEKYFKLTSPWATNETVLDARDWRGRTLKVIVTSWTDSSGNASLDPNVDSYWSPDEYTFLLGSSSTAEQQLGSFGNICVNCNTHANGQLTLFIPTANNLSAGCPAYVRIRVEGLDDFRSTPDVSH